MTKPGRIPCAVLGCKRTAPADKHPDGTRICCRQCWRLSARATRDRYRAAVRTLRRFTEETSTWRTLLFVVQGAFDDAVREATEARAGLL